jgi:uncharacterized protein (UPF0548 family)
MPPDVAGGGWHADELIQQLPCEPPGEPVAGGAWEVARRLVTGYRMADPAIVRATWDSRAPLEGREILLRLRLFRVIHVHARVRVTRTWDELREGSRVFGYEYETLPGHVEIGRMDYEVHKRLADGTVDFRIHARSRPSEDGAAWVRLGYRLFGRRRQVRFYLRCCERIARLTAHELGLAARPPAPAARLDEADAPDTGPLVERLAPGRRARSFATRRRLG